jgi:hypothetical protein
MLLEFRKLHTQTPLNCPPSCEDSPTHQMTHLLGGAAGRWWKHLCQPTIATLAAVTVVLTLFLSSVFVNQQAAMTSVMEKLTSPFKDCGKCAVTRTQCTKGGELLPKGIIVGTSDLQMRTLAVEDEDMVHHFLCYLCLHPCYCFLYIKSKFGGSFPLEFVARMIVFSGSRWQVWCQSMCWHQCF